jgi:hypothetical protein
MISLGIKEKTPEVETKIPKVVYSEAAHINTPEMQELYEKNLEIEKNNIKPPKEP